jgi:hypothetical protein
MLTVFLYTLRESLVRRMGIVLLALCVVVPVLYMSTVTFEDTGSGMLIVMGRMRIPVESWVRFEWNGHLRMVRSLWLMLALFLAAPLLSSYLEKGWADLLLTKAVPRWQFLLGRLLGTIFIFATVVYVMYGSTALFFSSRTGISAASFLKALGFSVLIFFCIVTMMALVGIAQPNPALLVIVGFLQITFSEFLANRKEIAEAFNFKWLKPTLDALHAVLPRTKELGDLSADVFARQPVESWAPLWWSVGLTTLYLALACWALHRKNI